MMSNKNTYYLLFRSSPLFTPLKLFFGECFKHKGGMFQT